MNETACRTQFHIKGFALRLVLKQRHKRTCKLMTGTSVMVKQIVPLNVVKVGRKFRGKPLLARPKGGSAHLEEIAG